MQKINGLLAIGIVLLISWDSRAAAPSKEMLAKIQAMTKAEVNQQLGSPGGESPLGGMSMSKKIESLEDRVKNVNRTAAYYSNYKKKKYRAQMVSFQGEIARACCPLKPATILDNQPWMRSGNAKQRDLARPTAGGKKNRGGRGRGQGKSDRKANGKSQPVKNF